MNFKSLLRKPYTATVTTLLSRISIGTNIYERDWDLLILLDTARVDALRSLAKEYDFLDSVGKHTSRGSSSPEFMAATFTEEYRDEIANTGYVSANAHTEYVFEHRRMPENQKGVPWAPTAWNTVDAEAFGLLDQVWRYTEHLLDGKGPADPAKVTDRAIKVGREYDFNRVIVHYHQPHTPYTVRAQEQDRDLRPIEKDPFVALRNGASREQVWELYLDELRYALDNVRTLLQNFDAETAVISADHGDLFGKYLNSHPNGMLHPSLRVVPWAEVPAKDCGEYEATVEQSDEVVNSAETRLRELGYLN